MQKSITDVVDVLNSLPPEQVGEVYHFALFLQYRSTVPVDESDEWSEQDRLDVIAASLRFADGAGAGDQ